jgi:tetratricopeptide (TPR) repeat protein
MVMRSSRSEEFQLAAPACPGLGTQLTRLSLVSVAILGCLTLTSCSTPKAARATANAEALRITGFWQPHQLYLLASPHPRLYVEVDAVEESSPSDGTLNRLRDFLATYCKKPGGIEIARSDVIPLKQALGVLPSALARKFLNGPPTNGVEPPPAFLYVLFYNDVLSDRPVGVDTAHPGARPAPHRRLLNRNPHVDMLPYPAMIYMNVHFGFKSSRDVLLLHEAGHVLGLAFRATNASDGHCLSRACLMNPAIRDHLGRRLLGWDPLEPKQKQLCERCLAQLAASQAHPPPNNLRFVGPVLVRSEAGYHVLNLPHRAKVILGEVSEQDCRDFAAAVRAETASPGDTETEQRADASGKDDLLLDPPKLRELLTRINADPYWMVQRVASRLWTGCASQYSARGQFTNAVQACRQAILADPDDDQSYNLLAWIKSTCSDASVRDGQEAVSAATRACELTKWKEWSWIDTLAAACAEAGDFNQAMKWEEQALRTGQPTASDQKGMRERIALYQRSQPFREKR